MTKTNKSDAGKDIFKAGCAMIFLGIAVIVGVVIIIIIIAAMTGTEDNAPPAAPITQAEESQEKKTLTDPNDTSKFKIDALFTVDGYALIRLGPYIIEIDQAVLETGYEWENRHDKWDAYGGDDYKWPVKVLAYFNDEQYGIYVGSKCDDSYVLLKVVEFNERKKNAIFNISVRLLHNECYAGNVDTIGFDNLELEISNTGKKPYFDFLIDGIE